MEPELILKIILGIMGFFATITIITFPIISSFNDKLAFKIFYIVFYVIAIINLILPHLYLDLKIFT